MQNIIFSTTRQWNPGDELIMAGITNILKELGVEYNPVIFNRNPDVRSCFQDEQLFKKMHVPHDFHLDDDLRLLEANLKLGFFDNSVKPDTDYSFADWVIFAGTPEWCNGRTYDLYLNILKHNIPVMILGVGGGLDVYDPQFLEVIQKAKALTVREENTLELLRNANLSPTHLACPALLCAPATKEKIVEKVAKIGLIYQATEQESVIWNGCSQETHDYQLELHRAIIKQYGDSVEFAIICHYIDELPLAKHLFPEYDVFYSYNAEDYIDIYRQFDLVIGSRVHGIGIAASVGVPGVAVHHSQRSLTCHGFLAEMVSCDDMLGVALHKVERTLRNAHLRSTALQQHKAQTKEHYKMIIREALQNPSVSYTARSRNNAINSPPRAITVSNPTSLIKIVFIKFFCYLLKKCLRSAL